VSEIIDIICQTMFPEIKKMFQEACWNYENNPKYHVKKYYDGTDLTGFCVYSEEQGYRNIAELHYVGKNPYIPLKMWRYLSKGANKLKAQTQRYNIRMLNIMRKLGFSVIDEKNNMIFLER
jgi:hypothetical protein